VKRTTARAWAGAAIALITALAVFGYAWRSHDASPDAQTASSRDDGTLSLRWRAGSAQQYAVRTDSTFRMNTTAPGATQSGQTIAVQLEGVLDFRTLEVGPSDALVGLRLSSVSLRISGVTDSSTDKALSTPFRVRFNANGMPSLFEFPADLAQEHRSVLENLVRTFQVALKDEPTWTAQEPSANGVYEAAYVRKGATQVEKTKRRYLPAAGSPKDALPEIASIETVRVDARRDWIAAMSVEESVRSGDPTGLAVDIRNRASIEVRAGFVTQAAEAVDAWRFVATAPPPAGATGTGTTPLTPEQASERMRADLATLDGAKQARHVWIHRLRDLLLTDGELPAALLKAMDAQGVSDRTRADIYLVLELAGTPQAQKALTLVISGGAATPTDRKRAIIALAGVAQPTTESIEALWSLSRSGASERGRDPAAGTATLALGSLGQRLIATQDDRYAALRTDLLSGATGGADAQQRASFVHALGNTGDASLSRDIVPLLSDSEPAVRGAAAQSLGTLGTDAAADELMARLQQEKVATVRGAIAESLVSWSSPTPSAMATVRRDIGFEREERARLAMAQVLGRNLATYPENRAALQALMRTEQSEQIRRQVASMLAESR
jgi:hypothetical protein